MMDEQRLAVAARGVVEGDDGGIEGDQQAPHLGLAIADLQAHAVPGLGQLEGSETVDGGKDGCEFHGGSLPPGGRAQAGAP